MPSSPADHDVLDPQFDYHSLSLLDLLVARDLYHLHLTKRKGAIATAIGCYLIRKGDSWPGDAKKIKGTGPKNFQTAEIRTYSWPCILVLNTGCLLRHLKESGTPLLTIPIPAAGRGYAHFLQSEVAAQMQFPSGKMLKEEACRRVATSGISYVQIHGPMS